VRRGAGLFRLPGLQPRRVRRGAGRDARSRIPHPSPVSGRLHQHGSGPALRAGVLSGCLLAGRSGAALPPQQCRLERAPREGRHSAQRHAPRHGRSRADADPARRGAPRMGRGLGSHPPGARLHEPHALARGSGEVASGVVRNDVAAPPGDHLRDQPPLPRRGPRPVPRRWRASRACEPRRRERRAQDPHGHLAIVGSHSTNGVAAIHSALLRTTTVRDLAEMFPERFNNKTNGVTPRRWLLLANPALARNITEAIGSGWITDLGELARPEPLADDRSFRSAFLEAKRAAKWTFAQWLRTTSGQAVDPDTIFDSQVNRIHEYKRQLLNALRIVVLST